MCPSTSSRGNIRTLGKTKVTVSLGTIHEVHIVQCTPVLRGTLCLVDKLQNVLNAYKHVFITKVE